MHISHLFAGKPQPFGPKNSPSSIVKNPYTKLTIKSDGAVEDEQGNKKLHGGPYMALHQYAQGNYSILANAFPNTRVAFEIGSIGENISAPNMNEHNVFIGDQYKIGDCIVQVVSPRAPCAKINHRYQNTDKQKIDLFIGEQGITGWYFSVLKTGIMRVNDKIELIHRETRKISVAQIWKLRELIKRKDLTMSNETLEHKINLVTLAINTEALSPEWKTYMQRVSRKLTSQLGQ